MVQAIGRSDWDVGTPAYQAATAAMRDMIKAAGQITETA